MPEPMDSPIVQALRALTGRNLFPQAPPPSQPVNAPFSPPASSWAEVQADPLKALANLVMGAVDPWGQPKGMNTGSIGGLLGAALPLASLARGAEAGMAARGTQAARGAEEAAPGIRAYHGSPHDFDKFALEKIGTGEGAQAYGHGLYFAENEGVARSYRDALKGRIDQDAHWANVQLPPSLSPSQWDRLAELGQKMRRVGNLPADEMQEWKALNTQQDAFSRAVAANEPKGRMYEVQINANPDHLLDWDKPLSQQHPLVRRALEGSDAAKRLTQQDMDAREAFGNAYVDDWMQQFKAGDVMREMGDPKKTAQALREQGIPGIKYLDGGSRAAGEGSRNYVIFDDALITILKKYGVALPMIEALRRKAAANNGRLPAADVHGAIQS